MGSLQQTHRTSRRVMDEERTARQCKNRKPNFLKMEKPANGNGKHKRILGKMKRKARGFHYILGFGNDTDSFKSIDKIY